MGLGYSGVTLASHVLLILSFLTVFARAQEMKHVQASLMRLATSPYMRLSLIAAMASLMVERAYYIMARLLTLEDIDLWQAHPAPELLSLASAVAVWHVSVAALVATDMMSAPRRGRIAFEFGGMIALWCLISVVLW